MYEISTKTDKDGNWSVSVLPPNEDPIDVTHLVSGFKTVAKKGAKATTTLEIYEDTFSEFVKIANVE